MDAPIIALPGMSVDGRIFDRLRLSGMITLEWLQPEQGEPFDGYCRRMSRQIPQGVRPAHLIGLSLGGLVAIEMARFLPVEKLVLISTIKSPEELPWRLRLMRTLPLYHLSRGELRIRALPYLGPFLGISDSEEIRLLQDMFRRFDDAYRVWAIRQLLYWEGCPVQVPYLHFHGTRDPIFPIRHIEHAAAIAGGDHFMVYRQADLLRPRILDFFGHPPTSLRSATPF